MEIDPKWLTKKNVERVVHFTVTDGVKHVDNEFVS